MAATAEGVLGLKAEVGRVSVDVVFDGVGGDIGRAAFDLLDRGGRMLGYGLSGGSWVQVSAEEAAAREVTIVPVLNTQFDARALVERVFDLAATGRLRVLMGQRFPLDQAAEAHAAVQSRDTVGRTVLDVRP